MNKLYQDQDDGKKESPLHVQQEMKIDAEGENSLKETLVSNQCRVITRIVHTKWQSIHQQIPNLI